MNSLNEVLFPAGVLVVHPIKTKENKLSEVFELTVNSLRAHIVSHGTLILRTLSYLTVNLQEDSHYELAVSFL